MPICRTSPCASATDFAFTDHSIRGPATGCDPSKLLIDPCGKSFHGDFTFGQGLFFYDVDVVDPHSNSADHGYSPNV